MANKNSSLIDIINRDELSEEQIFLEDEVLKAKKILEMLKEDDPIFNDNFEDDKWVFENHLMKTETVLDFSELRNAAKFRDYLDSSKIDLIKCWVAKLLNDHYPEWSLYKFKLLQNVIEITNFFDSSNVNKLVDYLRNISPAVPKSIEIDDEKELLKEIKVEHSGLSGVRSVIISTLEFLLYSNLQSYKDYNKQLLYIKKGIPYENFNRDLPSAKDVFKLDHCITEYFKSGISSDLSRLLYSPILLWWKITNVIPMRISEFCLIERNCISEENGNYYIKLPRKKQEKIKRRLQVVDVLEISEDIYNLINEYIHITNKYGKSETLVSYRTIKALKIEVEKTIHQLFNQKKNQDFFNRGNFSDLLDNFYIKVVYEEYNMSVNKQVNPNDTRHFAFCSLMLQGYSPIEIARLGGHSTLEAQYHYSYHTEYFIDIEVKKIMDGYVNKDGELEKSFEGQEISYEDIEKKSLFFPENTTRLPMDIGYCTDELQRCQSEECMLCEHWWIHPEELIKIKPLIQQKIRERKEKIKEMAHFLKNLNESFTETMHSDINPELYSTMDTKASAIQEQLAEIAHLQLLRGVEADE